MSNSPIKETFCTGCENIPEEETPHCPECGKKEPWEKRNKYDFSDVDLPKVFSHRFYEDNYELWNTFCEEVFNSRLQHKDIGNLPDDFPLMKGQQPKFWYFVDENYKLNGPYQTKRRAKEDAGLK